MTNKVSHIAIALSAALLFLQAAPCRAQYDTFGAEPVGTRWERIVGKNFSVIFPSGMDSVARHYLVSFESSREEASNAMKMQERNIPIILHPDGIGKVSSPVWAPRRLDVFTTPAAYGGLPLDHSLNVSLLNNFRLAYMCHYETNLAGFMQYPLGQQAVALGIGFKPSVWQAFSSAEAFVTDKTFSGPGRNAEYLMYWRAAFVSGDRRSYDRWHFGSYKDYNPVNKSHGYLLVSDIRLLNDKYYGIADALHIQLDDWWDVFGVWNRSFLEATGRTVRKHWRNISSLYAPMWYDDYQSRGKFTPVDSLLAKEERIYTEFKDIVPMGTDTYATKAGYQYSKQLVRIDSTGKQHYLRPFSLNTSRVVSDGGEWLYWSEVIPDVRYEIRDWSVIRKYNVRTRTIKTITRGSRLFNPSPVSDGSLLAVEYPREGGSAIVRINAETGAEIARYTYPFGGNCQFTEAVFCGEKIYAAGITDRGMGIFSFSLSGDNWRTEIQPQSQHSYLQQLCADGDKLCFVSDYDGVCNVYEMNPAGGKVTRLVNARFGAFYPTVRDGRIYFSDFDNMGCHPAVSDIAKADGREVDLNTVCQGAYPIAEREAEQAVRNNPGGDKSAELSEAIAAAETNPAEPYRRSGNLFKIHSWAPFYANINRIMDMSYEEYYQLASLGFTLVSQNELCTAVTTLGYGYHQGHHSGHLNFNYSGLYPVFELAVDFNDRNRELFDPNALDVFTDMGKPSLDASLKTYIPWNLSRGGWKRGLVPEFTLNFSNDVVKASGNMMTGFTAALTYYAYTEKSRRQLAPRLGIGSSVKYSEAAAGGSAPASNILSASLYGYLPGITRDQSIRLSAYHWQNFGQYTQAASLGGVEHMWPKMPRGFTFATTKDLNLTSVESFTLDYGIFAYLGDYTWPWLYYLMRLQIVPFFDYSICNSAASATPKHLYSYGTDILFGGHLFRIGAELNFGLRLAFPSDGTTYTGFILSHNLK